MNTTFNNQKSNHHKTIIKNFARSSLSLALTPLLLAAAHTAQADTEPTAQLPTIKIIASSENSIDNSLPNVDIIKRDDLNDPKVNDLATALQNQTSITLDRNKGGDTTYPSIRGMGVNNIELQIDGIDTPSYITYGHDDAFNSGELNSIEMDTVKQIDVVKGRQSAKQGGGALAGSVNMRTYRPSDFVDEDNKSYASVQSGYTSANKGFGNTLTAAAKSGNLAGMVIYTNRNYHELENMGNDKDKSLRDAADYQQNNLLLKGEMDVTKGKLIATGEYFDFEKETDPRYSNVVNYKEPADRKRLSLEGEFTEIMGLDELNANISYQKASNESRSWSNYKNEFYLGDFKQDYMAASVDAVKKLQTNNINHDVLFGLGINQKDFEFTRIQETSKNRSRRIPFTKRNTTFAYLKNNMQFGNGIIVAPGMRVERKKIDIKVDDLLKQNEAYQLQKYKSDGAETKVLPSLSLIAPISQNTKVYATYAEGAKNADNDNFVTYNHGFAYLLPNPDLEDEESKNIEVGVNYQNDKVGVRLSGFKTKYDNFIGEKMTTYNGRPARMPFNIKDVETKGLELESKFKLNDSLTSSLGATWIDAKSKTKGNEETPLVGTTPLIANLGLEYNPNETWGGKLNVKMVGEGKDPENKDEFRTPGFATTDLSAWWEPTDNLTLSGGVYNIFDRKYWNASDVNGMAKQNNYGPLNFDTYTMPGRNYGIKVKYEF